MSDYSSSSSLEFSLLEESPSRLETRYLCYVLWVFSTLLSHVSRGISSVCTLTGTVWIEGDLVLSFSGFFKGCFADSYLWTVLPISSARSGVSKSGPFKVMNRRLCSTLLPIALRGQLLIHLTALAPRSGQPLLTGVIKATRAISAMNGYSEVSPKSWAIVLRSHSVAVHFSLTLFDCLWSCSTSSLAQLVWT